MSFDNVPLSVVFILTLVLVFIAISVGVQLGKLRVRSGEGKLEVSGAMVGATMGLLAFMLAFTFNGAAGRHDTRKALVIEEANAIEKTWLRAGFLGEPYRAEVRTLLRDYVELRLNISDGKVTVAEGVIQSKQLQEKMWEVALAVGQQDVHSIPNGLFLQSLGDVFDVHLKRVTTGARSRVPPTIWVALYSLMAVGMIMMGAQIGQAGARRFDIELALAVSFSLVLLLIADLDRPQQGFVNVSQQAMTELLEKLEKP